MTIPVKELLTAMESIPAIQAKPEKDQTLAESIILGAYAAGRADQAYETWEKVRNEAVSA